MRQVVWRRIETEPTAPSFSELIGGWFQPRFGWAVVTAMLLVVFALGIYFLSNRRKDQQPVAVNPQKLDGDNGQPKQSTPDFSLAASRGTDSERSPDRRRPQKQVPRTEVRDRTNSVAMIASSDRPARPTRSTADGSIPSATAANNDSQKTLRLEIQTKNPNIRIIWFAPRDTNQVSPNSKGI